MTPLDVRESTPRLVEVILWLELPHDLVVGCQLIDPEQPPVSFGKVLSATMRAPLAGPPRRPDRIRVASGKLAVEVRRVVPKIKVVVAPTPELERLVARMQNEGVGGNGGDSPAE